MFDSLTKKLSAAFSNLAGRGKISSADLESALREIKLALLEADVALPIVKDLIAKVGAESLGEKKIEGVKAAEQIVKTVHDALVKLLSPDTPPAAIENAKIVMLVGLNGSGKTTTAAKLAKLLVEKKAKRVLLASTDIVRPQAREQLAILAARTGADSLAIEDKTPAAITKDALAKAKNYDVLILDTAGRMGIDEELMKELSELYKIARPDEVFLSVDALAGQDAINVAKAFAAAVPLSGIIMTRADGDARGGAALSMKSATSAPVRWLGIGEKLEDLDEFVPDRIAGRILGMGDIVSLVEKAQEKISEAEAEAMAEKMFSGQFTLNDMLAQLQSVKKLGSVGSIMKFIPGLGGMADKLQSAGMNDNMLKRQEAMLLSMTKRERAEPAIILAGRKKRIAAGAGVSVADVEKLLKGYEKTKAVMAQMNKLGGLKGMMSMLKAPE